MSDLQPEPAVPPLVVVEDDTPAITEAPPPKKDKRAGPKWEVETRERVRSGIRRFAKPLAELGSSPSGGADEAPPERKASSARGTAFCLERRRGHAAEDRSRGAHGRVGVHVARRLDVPLDHAVRATDT